MGRKALSGVMLALLVIGLSSATLDVKFVRAQMLIYIMPDGSIDPPTAPIEHSENVYRFTGNIFGAIRVECNNIIVDGAGYTLDGSDFEAYGFYLHARHVVIRNTNIRNYPEGSDGVYIDGWSSFVTISGNNITNCEWVGITLQGSSDNIIYGNNLSGNGIDLLSSSNNIISENSIKGSTAGLYLSTSSNNNSITSNNLDNGYEGISIYSSFNNTVSKNRINDHAWGIRLSSSSLNLFFGNEITNHREYGIEIDASSNNNFSLNNVINNDVGIYFSSSSNNRFYHNNFNNTVQVLSDGSNVWDDGYPSGGNYWSDYTDVDECSGPNQDQPGSDYIWDHPYVIDLDNQDHYPIVNEWKWSIADVNHDGVVNVLDAAAISAHWYPGPPLGPLGYNSGFDINGDGATNVLDAAIVSAYWTGPPKGPLAP